MKLSPVAGLACVAVACAASCLDPLYEDPGPTGSWVVCCANARVSTCPCAAETPCDYQLRACAGGTCVSPASEVCRPGPGDGGFVGGDGGMALDGGASDAGTGDGGTVVVDYEPCCVGGRVTSCACPGSGCDGQAFVACAAGACVPDGGHCPITAP